MIKAICGWVERYELVVLGGAAPLLLFPVAWLPWVGLGLIGLTWVSRRISRGYFTKWTGVEIPSLILAGMAVVGYCISVDPGLSRARLWNILLDLAVFFGLANGLRAVGEGKQARRRVDWMAGGVVAVALGVMGLSLVGTDWNSVRFIDIPWLYERLPSLIRGLPNSGVAATSDLINPRWVGITMGVMVPVLVACAAWLKRGWLRLLCGATAVVGTGLLLLSQTLQGVMGLAAGILLLLVWRSRWWLLLLIPAMGLVTGGWYLLGPVQAGEVLFAQDNPIGVAIVLRLDIWSRALAMMRDMPFTGIGLNTFPTIQWHFYPGHLLGPEPHAHNIYLQTALDMGLPGLAAFIWFFIAWGARVWHNIKGGAGRAYRGLLAGVAAGVTAYLTAGWMDAMMLGAKPSVIVWGLMGMAAAPGYTRDQDAAETPLPKNTRRLVRALPLLVLIGIGLSWLLLKPESLVMNLGTIQAHQGLYPAQTGGTPDEARLEAARGLLLEAQARDPGRLRAYELLGRIYAWQGDEEAALQALSYRVRLDGEDALLRYFPSGSWLRQLQGSGRGEVNDWQDLITVYSQWMYRFPERAYTYAEIGMVWQCALGDPGRAASAVQAGIDKGAVPAGLLERYAGMLEVGDTALCGQETAPWGSWRP
jgi:putative inorganic carbon (HCO3(-)) transporter